MVCRRDAVLSVRLGASRYVAMTSSFNHHLFQHAPTQHSASCSPRHDVTVTSYPAALGVYDRSRDAHGDADWTTRGLPVGGQHVDRRHLQQLELGASSQYDVPTSPDNDASVAADG